MFRDSGVAAHTVCSQKLIPGFALLQLLSNSFASVGKVTALGAAQSTAKGPDAANKDEGVTAVVEDLDSNQAAQIKPGSSAIEAEDDAHWQPSTTAEAGPQSSLDQPDKKRKRRPPPPPATAEAPQRAARARKAKKQLVVDTVSQDSEESEMQHGSIDLQAVHSKGQHKHQVIEDDDIVLDKDVTGIEQGNDAAQAMEAALLAPTDEEAKDSTPAKTSGNALDRVAALSSVLKHVSKAPQVAAASATAPEDSAAVKSTSKPSLLDAMLADDDIDYPAKHELPDSTVSAQVVHVQQDSKSSVPSDENITSTSTHEQHGSINQGNSASKDKEPASFDVTVKPLASPTAMKGSLRERMKALGMAKT